MFKIGSVFIPVENLATSIRWYEKMLGIIKIDEWEEGNERGAGFYFPNDLTQLALIQVEDKQPTQFAITGNKRNVYFNFLTDDIQGAFNHLKHNNVKVSEIEDFGGMKCFDFYDLDGNTFSVVNEVESSPYHRDEVRKLQSRK